MVERLEEGRCMEGGSNIGEHQLACGTTWSMSNDLREVHSSHESRHEHRPAVGYQSCRRRRFYSTAFGVAQTALGKVEGWGQLYGLIVLWWATENVNQGSASEKISILRVPKTPCTRGAISHKPRMIWGVSPRSLVRKMASCSWSERTRRGPISVDAWLVLTAISKATVGR